MKRLKLCKMDLLMLTIVPQKNNPRIPTTTQIICAIIASLSPYPSSIWPLASPHTPHTPQNLHTKFDDFESMVVVKESTKILKKFIFFPSDVTGVDKIDGTEHLSTFGIITLPPSGHYLLNTNLSGPLPPRRGPNVRQIVLTLVNLNMIDFVFFIIL